MVNKFKNENGFTLLDTMISVGFFSIICIFIAHIAIYTKDSNQRAAELDQASAIALSALEIYKSFHSPDDIFITDFADGAQINMNEQDFLFNRDQIPETEFNETIVLYKFYDADFNRLYNVFEENPLESIENPDIRYIQYFYIYSKAETEGFTYVNNGDNLNTSGEMFNIRTNVVKIGADADINQLVNYSTKKYFINKG